MATIAPAFVQVHPSFTEPEIILQLNQASGVFDLFAGGEPRKKLGQGDLAVYFKRMDLRTSMASGQAAYNSLPSVTTVMSMVSTATYLLRVRAEYDHHDTAAAGNWGFSIVNSQRLGMRQGHFQLARNAALSGINPANGEGLLNAPGATAITLPADSNGNTTISTYDNGQLAVFILGQIRQLLTRTMNLGVAQKVAILGPQQDLGQMEIDNIVQLVQYQRVGAGSTTTAGVIKDVLEMNNIEITWGYDDTLIGKGSGGTDAILITMPEVRPTQAHPINTNVFAELEPGLWATTLMYCDMAAPREIPTPLAGGAIDVTSEWRISSGLALRPEATVIISAAH
jgi:hypothetical protein